MICIDNSEWMRNGDYSPSRLQAQTEAVNLLCGAKTQVKSNTLIRFRVLDCSFWLLCRDLISFLQLQSNPENTVGILTMAGKGVRVLTTPTSDLGKILACMHGKCLLKATGRGVFF